MWYWHTYSKYFNIFTQLFLDIYELTYKQGNLQSLILLYLMSHWDILQLFDPLISVSGSQMCHQQSQVSI